MTAGGGREMDTDRLRALMEGAVAGRPPAPHLVGSSLRQGQRIRRRRRLQATAALAAGIVIAIAAPLVAQALTAKPPPVAPRGGGPTAFVIVNTANHTTIVPVSERSDTRGQPIPIRGQTSDVGLGEVAGLAPGGRTLYVLTNAGLTPVNTATRTAGRLIPVHCGRGCYGIAMVLSPNGRTAYVEVGAVPVERHTLVGVIPVSLTTGKDGRFVPLAGGPGFIAITPDGRTVYVELGGGGHAEVVPISTASDTAQRPVTRSVPTIASAYGVAMAPHGHTLYLAYASHPGGTSKVATFGELLVPVNTATGTTSAPILAWNFPGFVSSAWSPDGQTAYLGGSSGVARIRTATNALAPQIRMPSWMKPSTQRVDDLVMSADGRTLYAINWQSGIQPVDVATGALLAPRRFGAAPRGFGWASAGALDLDGTVFVAAQRSQSRPGSSPVEIVPFSLATGRAGRPISAGSGTLGSAMQIIFAP
jgi:DNA-binding beta-propeller fold protein YncE